MFRRYLTSALAALCLASPAPAKTRKAPAAPNYSCTGYICVDAATGKVLAEQSPDSASPPASVTKLMTFLVILDDFAAGTVKPSDMVTADKDAYNFLGTKAYLTVGEKHTYEQMLYALMVQSANDGAVAIAKQEAGSTEAFVAKMNARAASLGMARTRYTSPHGFPPGRSGRAPDMTSARDIATLAREILKRPEALRYTSTKDYHFRDGPDSRKYLDNFANHNKLLWSFSGCDGLKTGWSGDGASIATTASRGGKRVIAVVLGGKVPTAQGTPEAKSSQAQTRALAGRLMEEGLAKLGVGGAPATGFVGKSSGTVAPAGDEGDAPAAVPAGKGTAPAAVPAPAPGAPMLPKFDPGF